MGEVESDISDKVEELESKYKTYAKLKAGIKELTAKTKSLELDIIEDLNERDGSKLETEYATFSMVSRQKWQYTSDLQEKEQAVKFKLKQLKKAEETSGKAIKISDGMSLRCQLVKGK